VSSFADCLTQSDAGSTPGTCATFTDAVNSGGGGYCNIGTMTSNFFAYGYSASSTSDTAFIASRQLILNTCAVPLTDVTQRVVAYFSVSISQQLQGVVSLVACINLCETTATCVALSYDGGASEYTPNALQCLVVTHKHILGYYLKSSIGPVTSATSAYWGARRAIPPTDTCPAIDQKVVSPVAPRATRIRLHVA
jgi:hypothetical protein